MTVLSPPVARASERLHRALRCKSGQMKRELGQLGSKCCRGEAHTCVCGARRTRARLKMLLACCGMTSLMTWFITRVRAARCR